VDDPPALLSKGDLTVQGRLAVASNASFLGRLAYEGAEAHCVYKPIAGERPLWDFPDGTLAARELAAYAVSEASGWAIVPPTVLRDGPYGPGMCQLWIDADPERALIDIVSPDDVRTGWLPVLKAFDEDNNPVLLMHADDPRLRRMALLDIVCNNADRKGGHVLTDLNGHVYGVDHGVCFHVEDKLRTVLWGWAGRLLTADERQELALLRTAVEGQLGGQLSDLLDAAEVRAVRNRIDRLLETARFPRPGRRWAVIPWPAF
jgi:uncharacterized repeat protein (TIGR03843 family)